MYKFSVEKMDNVRVHSHQYNTRSENHCVDTGDIHCMFIRKVYIILIIGYISSLWHSSHRSLLLSLLCFILLNINYIAFNINSYRGISKANNDPGTWYTPQLNEREKKIANIFFSSVIKVLNWNIFTVNCCRHDIMRFSFIILFWWIWFRYIFLIIYPKLTREAFKEVCYIYRLNFNIQIIESCRETLNDDNVDV